MGWLRLLTKGGYMVRNSSSDRNWLHTNSIQIDGKNSISRPIQIVIGLDFGTSFTKVIVGESRVRYAVPFERYAVGENPTLLPSALSVMSDTGECTLGTDLTGGVQYDNLKMPLIELRR